MTRLAAALKGSISTVAVCALLLQGCAQTASTAPSGYATAADDPCQAGRKTLLERNDYFAASIAGGAVAGGVAGALATGSPIRALVAAAAGAAAGAIGSYYASKKEAIASKSRLSEAVHGDIATEIQEVDTTTANFLALSQCRFNAARSIKEEFKAQRISREDAEARLARQRMLFNEDVAFADSLGAKMTQRAGEFEFAATELLKDDPAAQRELERRRTEQAKVEAAEQAKFEAEEKARLAAEERARVAAARAQRPAAPRPAPQPAPAATPSAAAPAPAAASAPTPQASVQPALRVRTLPVAATPMDIPGVSQLTDTNRIKRRAFSDQLTEAKSAADSAFKIDAGISLAPVRTNAG